jgi:hypothetical protein
MTLVTASPSDFQYRGEERMSIESRFYNDPFGGSYPDGLGLGDAAARRAQVERQQQERAAERQEQIALQSSPFSEPEERIRLWEKLHALQLPRSATHKLVRVIAEQTDLSIQQVLEAQLRRAAQLAVSARSGDVMT